MRLSEKELFCIHGGFCLLCSIINGLKKFLTYLNVKHLMKHVFSD